MTTENKQTWFRGAYGYRIFIKPEPSGAVTYVAQLKGENIFELWQQASGWISRTQVFGKGGLERVFLVYIEALHDGLFADEGRRGTLNEIVEMVRKKGVALPMSMEEWDRMADASAKKVSK